MKTFIVSGQEHKCECLSVVSIEDVRKDVRRRFQNSQLREWTTIGKASYLTTTDGMVLLERDDASQVSIPFDDLPTEDRIWIYGARSRQRKLDRVLTSLANDSKAAP